jgi:GH18 family chitinase
MLRRLFFLLCLLIFIGKANTQTCRQVIGYIPNWQWYDRAKLVNPMTIQYSKYSILNYSFFKPEISGAISSTDAWADENLLLGQINWSTSPVSYLPNTSIPSRAHAAGTKVLASIGGWTLSDNFPSIAANASKRAIFAHSCVQLVHQYNFDGIDIDWEYPGYTDHQGTAADKVNFTIFLQQIRDSLSVYGNIHNKSMKLTACVGASQGNMSNVEWSNIVPILDYINLMSYDFFGTWDNTTNHNSPLFAPAQGDASFNIAAAVNTLLTTYNVPPSKLNAGVAFYGRSVKTPGTPTLHGTQTHNADAATFPEDEGTPLYYNILAKANLFTDHYDNLAKSPYMLGKNGLQTFLSYDNPTSITEKANFIVSKNLAGAIIWEITGDYIAGPNNTIASTPMVDALNASFCGTTPPPPPPVCSSPLSLIATPSATSSVLNWSNTGANTYEIQYKTSTATTWTTVTSTTNSYNLTGLLGCTAYNWQVKSICSSTLASNYSTASNFSTLGCCSVPTNLSNIPAPTALSLSWNNMGATAYTVQWKLQTATTWTTLQTNTNSTQITGLLACTNYQWRVQTVCASGNSAYSATKIIKTTGCAGCLPPSVYTSVPAQISATLTWGNMGATSYTVRYRKSGTITWTTLSPSPTTNTATLNNLLACTVYQWHVRSVCGTSTSSYGSNQTFTTTCPPPPTVCNAPTSLSVTTTNNSATLNWVASGATSYAVEWKLSTATTWTVVTPNSTSNTLTINNLATCTDYQFRVKSICSSTLSSAFTAVVDGKTLGCTNTGGGGGGTGTTNCAAPSTFYFTSNNYIPIGEIKIGQGRLHPVWGVSVDHFVPQNRLNWAIANVHAAHLFRNVVGTDKIPANFYFATSGKESFNGCDAGILAAPANTAYPYSYQAASLGDGCFQIENSSAYTEMVSMYPQRFPAGQHANIIGGAHYETAALGKAYYDIFAVKWWEVSKGWDPKGFFNNAADPSAAIKLMAIAYNRGLWYHALDTVLFYNRAAAITAPSISPYFTSNYYGYDYQKALSNYCKVLDNQASTLDPSLTATNPATGQPYNYFTNYFDTQVTWANVSGYLDAIVPLYPTVNFVTLKSSVQTTFNAINGGNSISFRYQLGGVLDKILLLLPADDPSANIATNYGCVATVTPPPTTCSVPTGLNAIPQNTSTTLSWTAVTGATYYKVQWKLASSTSWSSFNAFSNSMVVLNLQTCSNYEFKVSTICGSGTSFFSTIKTFVSYCPPPPTCTVPNGLIATPQSTSATLTWSSASGANSYSVQWKLLTATTWTTVSSATNSLTINNLQACKYYKFQVASVCNGLLSAYSVVNSFTAICPPPPTCPIPNGLIATPQSTAATLIWSSASGANSYSVQWKLSTATTWTTVSSATNSLTINNLQACKDYQFQVASVCNGLISAYSLVNTFTTICPPPPTCPIPNGLIATPQSTTATLTWSSASGANSYSVQWKLSTATTWTTVSSATNSLTINNLQACKDYQFQVASVCNGTLSNYSTLVNFTTNGCTAPPPALTSYCSSFSLNSAEEWIQYFKMGTFTNSSGNNFGFGNFINMWPTLLAGSTVQVRFKPGFVGAPKNEHWRLWVDWNRDGDFTDANELCFTVSSSNSDTLTQNITVPVPVSFGYTRMRLSMKRDVPTDICEVFSLGEVEDYAPILTNTPFSPGNNTNRSAESETEEIISKQEMTLYPNPGTNAMVVRFYMERKDEFSLQITDFQGKKVFSRELANLEEGVFEEKVTEVSDFPTGIYTVSLCKNGVLVVAKRWIKI